MTDWSLQTDDEGHRDYLIDFKVETTSTADGPAIVSQATGLPVVGTYWQYGNDVDLWAFCWPTATVRPYKGEGEPGRLWIVTKKFSTRPHRRCQDTPIEDPLLEPPRVSGSFLTRTDRAEKDRHGDPIRMSSLEPIEDVERDMGGPTVSIDMNVPFFNMPETYEAVHKLNDAPLWGMKARKIKLNAFSWTANLYGICDYYYTLRFDFEVRYEGWDPTRIDMGFHCLRGTWRRSSADTGTSTANLWWDEEVGLGTGDPDSFMVALDKNDEKYSKPILLNGQGGRLREGADPVTLGPFEVYDEYNFLTLGIPEHIATLGEAKAEA